MRTKPPKPRRKTMPLQVDRDKLRRQVSKVVKSLRTKSNGNLTLREVERTNWGRPSRYTPDIIPNMLEMFTLGMSKCSVMLNMRISPVSWLQWEQEHPEFNSAIRYGEMLSRGWWEEQGRTNIKNTYFNNTLYMMNMQNRFQWTRKLDFGGTAAVNIAADGGTINQDNRQVTINVEERVAKTLEILQEVGAFKQISNSIIEQKEDDAEKKE